MSNNKQDITKIVTDEIIDKTIDLSIDYAEIGIDEILKDGLFKEIPIVKSVIAFYNISNSIIDRHKAQKILTFFKEFHSKTIDSERLKLFKTKFSQDKKYRASVVELIILLNERFFQTEKSKVLANLIVSHIEEKISWTELLEISVILDNIHPKGFAFLEKMSQQSSWANHEMNIEGEALMFACGIGWRYGTAFRIIDMGQKLFNYGIKQVDTSKNS